MINGNIDFTCGNIDFNNGNIDFTNGNIDFTIGNIDFTSAINCFTNGYIEIEKGFTTETRRKQRDTKNIRNLAVV